MATWSDIQRGIFAGESGGDYGALFNYQNRPDGRFSNVDLTQMTVDEALQFADPSGPYAQYVKGQVGRVATPMGAYQVVGTTLRAAKEGLGLTGNERMTPELQDRIGQWIYKTQGTGAWEGYKGPRVSTREGSQMDQMQQPQQPMGFMDRLRDPRTRLALSALSRSSVGQRLGEIAAADLARQQGLEDEQRKLGQAQQVQNRTAAWLRTQPNGERYAAAIESGMDARTVYTQYMRDASVDQDPNVQSRTMLPDNSGSVVTMRDGTQFVLTAGGQKLTGAEADAFVQKAQSSYVQQQQDIYGARRSGTLGADIELGSQAEQVKAEGKNKVAWIDDIRSKRDNIMSTISNYDMALQALDAGASTGRVAALLPTVTAQTQLLETAKKRLGLDVIGSVTFGALSEGELALAMDTGLPSSNLGPEELRKWILDRKAAKEKAAQALFETAAYLAKPNTTYDSYYTDFLGISKPNGGSMSDNPLGLE